MSAKTEPKHRSGRSKTTASAPKTPSSHKCEVRCQVVCRGVGTLHLTGVRKGDPVFYCCLACHAYLKRQGVRMKYVTEKKK